MLWNSIISHVYLMYFNNIASIFKVCLDLFYNTSFTQTQYAFYILGNKEFWLLFFYCIIEEFVQYISFVVYVTLHICHRKTLAWKATNDNISRWYFCYIYVLNVCLYDVVIDISFVGCHSICINVVSPNDIVTSLYQSQI